VSPSNITRGKPILTALDAAKSHAIASAQTELPWFITYVQAWESLSSSFLQTAAKTTWDSLTAASKFTLTHPVEGGFQHVLFFKSRKYFFHAFQ
jgi:hypothetical protein